MSGVDNVVGLIEAVAHRAPAATALRGHGGELTYARLVGRAGGWARFLHLHGVRAGDRVALSIPNRWPFAVALLGVLKLGATVVLLDPRLTDEQRRRVLAEVRPRAVAWEVVGDEADWPVARGDAPALILCGSGSAGLPTARVVSHEALEAVLATWAGPVMGLRTEDVVLAGLPWSCAFGLTAGLLAPLVTGARVAVLERFAPDAALAAIREQHVTVVPGLTTLFRRLLDMPGLDPTGLGSVRLCVVGAGPCPRSLIEEWRQRTGLRLLRGAGTTELGPLLPAGADGLAGDPHSTGVGARAEEVRP